MPEWAISLLSALLGALVGGLASAVGGDRARQAEHTRAIRYDLYRFDLPKLRRVIDAGLASDKMPLHNDMVAGPAREAARKARTGSRWQRQLGHDLDQLSERVERDNDQFFAQHSNWHGDAGMWVPMQDYYDRMHAMLRKERDMVCGLEEQLCRRIEAGPLRRLLRQIRPSVAVDGGSGDGHADPAS